MNSRGYWLFPITTLILTASAFQPELETVYGQGAAPLLPAAQRAAARMGAARGNSRFAPVVPGMETANSTAASTAASPAAGGTAGNAGTSGTAAAGASSSASDVNSVLPASLNIADLQAKAEKGDAESQLYLGMAFSLGQGVVQNDKEALKWLQMAAKQKNYQAQYILSLWCMNGHVVTKNEEMGLKLLQSAANGGFPEAQYEYASYLAEQEKQEEALPWMKKAAEQGYVPAETALGGYLISTAKADSKEFQDGMSWLILASMEGDSDAQATLGACFIEQKENVPGIVWLEVAAMNGDTSVTEVLKNIEATPEECFDIGYTFLLGDGYIPKNYDRFKLWTGKAAEKGNASAQFILGMYYVSGINHESAPEKGVALLEKAAASDFAEAQVLLGVCCRGGYGTAQDARKAVEWFQKAAKLKNANAFTQLGFCSLLGIGVASNEETTKKLFEKACELKDSTAVVFMEYCTKNSVSFASGAAVMKQLAADAKSGDAPAQFLMGEIFTDGCGVKRDDKTAAAYYNLAVKQNFAPALNALSWNFEMGIYVQENRDTAISLAMKAAEQGNAEALSYLNTIGQVEAAENTQKTEK